MLLLGKLSFLVGLERLNSESFEILGSERLIELVFLEPLLLHLYQQLARVVRAAHACRSIHGIGILESNDVIELIDLPLDLPASALLCPELLADKFPVVRNGFEPLLLQFT